MLACDCQGQWLYRCYSVWGDCYFRCGGIFIVIFYLVVMTVDIPGCLASWSVNVMVRGTIFSTVEEEFIVI